MIRTGHVVTLLLQRWYKCIIILLLLNVSFIMMQYNKMAFGIGIRRIGRATLPKSSHRILSLSSSSSSSSSVTTRLIPKISRLQSSQRHLFGIYSSSSNRITIQPWRYSCLDRSKCNTIQQFTTSNNCVSQCCFFRLYATSSYSTGTTGSSNVPLHVQHSESLNSILVPPTTTPATTPSMQRGYENYIDLELPEGRCIGLKLLDLPVGHPDELTKDAILRCSSLDMKSDNNNNNNSNNQTTTNHNNHGNKLHWIYDKLHIDEINYGLIKVKDDSSIKNQKCFWLGRLAMREGLQLIASSSTLSSSSSSSQLNNLQQLNGEETTTVTTTEPTLTTTNTPLSSKDTSCIQNISILKDEYGRPQVPNGYIGSISHKEMIGVALISSSSLSPVVTVEDNDNNINKHVQQQQNSINIRRTVGIDIEKRQSTRKSIGRKVLTPYELNDLGQIPGISIDEEVLLRFSLKECVYKSIHPLLNQYISFQEAEIKPLPNGTSIIKLFLKSNAHTKLHTVSAHWLSYNTEYFLCSSSATIIES